MAARAGVEPTTLRLKVIASTNAPQIHLYKRARQTDRDREGQRDREIERKKKGERGIKGEREGT